MELRHLRAFAAIVDAGGFGRAIGRLHVSQPALSRQIRSLEADLGVRLFDRVGRRIRLTSEGEDLIRRSRRLILDADALEARARALKSGETGVLRIGATPQVIEGVLAKFLARYRRRHPNVEIHLVEDGGASLAGRLDDGEVEVTIMLAGDARFEQRLLFPVYCLAVVFRAHRLARRATLEAADLADEAVVVLRQGFGSRAWFEAACAIAHVRPRVVLESGSPHTLVALARAGHAIAIIPSAVTFDRAAVRAPILTQAGAPIGGWTSVNWDPQRFLAPYVERFVEEVTTFARRTYPGRDFTRRAPPLPKSRQTAV